MALTIRTATTEADYRAFGALCQDYAIWIRRRYETIPWLLEEVFGHQSFDEEQRTLHIKYGPPKGKTLLAELDGGAVVAGGAWHCLEDGVCELKRIFVSDVARGHGLGRKLTEALMDDARAAGFTVARLDTGNLLHEAIALYHSLGFVDRSPYLNYPDRFLAHLTFMQRRI